MKRQHHTASPKVDNQTSRIAALCLLALILSLALTGCKNPPRPTTDSNPAGIYTLVSVDGEKVPCRVKHDGVLLSIKSGTFTITADGQCHSVMIFSPPDRADIRREVKATYTQNGTELTMKWEGAGVTRGRINGNQFTMNNEGMVLAYQR